MPEEKEGRDKGYAGMGNKSKREGLYLKGKENDDLKDWLEGEESKQGSEIIQCFVNFAQISNEVLLDKNLSDSAVRLWGIYHKYSRRKNLNKDIPVTFVKQKTIASDLGWSERKVRKANRELREAGYIRIKNRGWMSNLIFLYARKYRKKKDAKIQ